jgi:tRNA dimethylallyltransferase
MTQTPYIICLMGPTASGKTDLAVELVQQHPQLEIISADSALVYRGLDIGTAKPGRDILTVAPHRLIDIRDPAEPYSAGDFRQDALQHITDIHRQGKIPLLVGGTMLYFWVLQHGLAALPVADPATRSQIAARADAEGWPALHVELMRVDPDAAQRIHPHDSQRIQRALEVWLLTGKPISVCQQQSPNDLPFRVINMILAPQHRESLSQRIEQRLQRLFARGFIEEVQNLRQRPEIHADLPALRAVGYRQVWEYLEGKMDLPALQQQVYFATCQLAKRQLTWLRRWQDAEWLNLEEPTAMLCQHLLHNIKTMVYTWAA